MDWMQVILAGFALASLMVSGYISVKLANIAASNKITMENSISTSATMEKVHVAVNSNMTAAQAKIDDLTKTVLDLSKQIATSQERERK